MSKAPVQETLACQRPTAELLETWKNLQTAASEDRYAFADSMLLREWCQLPWPVTRDILNLAKRGKHIHHESKQKLRSEDDVLDIIDEAVRKMKWAKGRKVSMEVLKVKPLLQAAMIAKGLIAMKKGQAQVPDEPEEKPLPTSPALSALQWDDSELVGLEPAAPAGEANNGQ